VEYLVERVVGIEPTRSAWKADVLPLNHTRAVIDQARPGQISVEAACQIALSYGMLGAETGCRYCVNCFSLALSHLKDCSLKDCSLKECPLKD
jgi:hypothetical protein